jgi:hypothetical protein
MADFPLRLLAHVRATALVLRLPAAWIPTFAGFVAVVIALLTKPGATPGFWNWIGILGIATLSGLAILLDLSRNTPRASQATRNELGIVAFCALVLGVALNLLASVWGAIALVCGVVLIAALAHRVWRVRPVSMILSGVVAVVAPMWVWISLDAATWGLLLLLPIAILAWFADRYMASALGAAHDESMTLGRSWRFLAWLALLAGTLLTTVLAVSTGISNTWAVIGAFGALICIGADAGLPQHASLPGVWSRPLMATGFAWLSLCWLASL